MTNPLDDDSQWVFLGSRFDPDWTTYDMLDEMIEESIEALPIDDPSRLLWYMLPKPPR